MSNVALAIYIAIGVLLSIFWWNKKYKRDYDYAKAMDDGVEEGMATMFLLVLALFWPLVIIYKILKVLIEKVQSL